MNSNQMLKKIIPVEDAISVLHDGDVLATSGYGGHGMPEQLLVALEKRFLETGRPRGLTLIHATGQGDAKEKGLNLLAHEGLLQRVIGGYFGLTPKICQLVQDNKIQAYNLPEGIITHLYRDIAAAKPGTLSKVGLGTFVDAPAQAYKEAQERSFPGKHQIKADASLRGSVRGVRRPSVPTASVTGKSDACSQPSD